MEIAAGSGATTLGEIPDPRPQALWRRADFERDGSWRYSLAARQIDELDRAMDRIRADGKADFELPSWRGLFAQLRHDVEDGRGFALVRGVPVERYATAELETLFLGIGRNLGHPVTQSATAEPIAHVTDKGPVAGLRRGFQTNREASFHADLADAVGLLCLRQAKAGGQSLLASSATAYAVLRDENPGALAVLERGFAWDRREEHAPGEAPIGPTIPIFGAHRGRFRAVYNRNFNETVCKRLGTPMSGAEIGALDALDDVLARDELQLPMDFLPGDIQLVSNETVLHARTAYEDFDDPAKRRHLMRLWWNFERYADDAPKRPLPYGNLGQRIA